MIEVQRTQHLTPILLHKALEVFCGPLTLSELSSRHV